MKILTIVFSFSLILLMSCATEQNNAESYAKPESATEESLDLKARTMALMEECINNQDINKVAEFYAQDVKFHDGQDGIKEGHGPIIDAIKFYQDMFPNLHYSVEMISQDGNKVTIRWVGHTDKTDQDALKIPGMTIFEYDGDKIKEIWQEWDRSLVK